MSHEQWMLHWNHKQFKLTDNGCCLQQNSIQHAAVQIQLAYGYRRYHTIQAASLRAAGTARGTRSPARVQIQKTSGNRKGPEAKIWLFLQAPQLRRVYDCLAVKPGLEWKHSMTGKSDPSRATLEKATRLNALSRNEGQVPGDKLEETGVPSEWRGNQRDDQRCTGGRMEADEEERGEPEMDQKMDQ
ncbi:hypothetical protein B0H10DRAFT_1947154 [Mycena sp. CBHHK59/15]|nr:hypothetical protein B0H10DRAFT_1947154 [Mycena sp. CBHHK59/15]